MYKLLGLDEAGAKALNRSIFACVLSNLALLLSFGVILEVITVLLAPLLDGTALNTQKLWWLCAAALAVVVVYFLVYRNEYDRTYTASYSESEKIRVDVAERIRKLPLSFFNKKDLSELTTNMMADCASIEHAMSHVVPGLFANIITIILACALLAFYNWRMSAALLAAMPVSLGIILLSKGIQAKFGERTVWAKLDVAERTQEYLEGIKVVKAFSLSVEKFAAYKDALHSMMLTAIKFELVSGVFIVSAMMILQVGIGLVTFVGVMLLSGGAIAPVKVLFFILIAAKIYAPLIVVLTLLPELFFLLISTRRMRALRNEPVMTGEENVKLTDFTIELKDVTFACNEDDVIKNFSMTIPQNSVTALVGPSGSGKTTVSRLIARFWDVNQGAIFIGEQNIRTIDPETLMRYMSFVFQDVVLFNDTVMNNIRIGRQGATDEDVYDAAKRARCDEFIREMQDAYATVIGENGSTLSGGERQRISIARALLKDAPIVLLDEATASLDPENETLIQAAISELVRGRTVIVIAHRLRTVLGADTIAVLEQGRLVEQGTAAQLIAKDGLFARLYRIQQESLGWTSAH
ncbi:MAG: ABC transporter ATP-binding protein/permease [Treponema sp.]|jgi:ATP-binding cassette subfamily B protein|nr:ABC transporter ATP-binding protein/permease [Treponema sp.]